MNSPTCMTGDRGHVLTWPGEDAVLRFVRVTQDHAMRLWAEVSAEKEDGTTLNREQFNLLDGHRRTQFAVVAAVHNGQQPGDWDQRLLQAIAVVQEKVASGEGISPTKTPPSLAFPVAVFPPALQTFILACAEALPCPPDFLAVPMLSQLGAAIGTSHVLELKPGWVETARLWTAVVADPGSKKSPALHLVMQPLFRVQEGMRQQYGTLKKAYETDYAVYEKDLVTWKRNKNAQADERPEKPEEPLYPQAFTTDATLEALASVLEANPRGLLFLRDELAAWARGMNQYKGGKGADRSHWLEFWNGATTVINRKSRKEPLVLRDPFVCVAGCLPPEVLGDLADEAGREDGFVHRILFAYPDIQPLAWTESAIAPSVQDAYRDVIAALYALQGTKNTAGESVPRVLSMTPMARSVFVEWAESHYAELNAPDMPPRLRGPWAKMEGYCARLALILFLTRKTCQLTDGGAIDEASVLGAAALMDYFKSHATRVYSTLHATPDERRVTSAFEWIRRHGGEASLRDLCRYKVAGVATMKDAEILASLLVTQGHGVIMESCPPTGGHLRKVFHLHV